jgi:hypothetical protein
MFLDGRPVGDATYGISRPDVQRNWPSAPVESGFRLLFDTTSVTPGVHGIHWVAKDSSGNLAISKTSTIRIDQLNCPAIGAFDGINGDVASGWSIAPGTPASAAQVRLYVDAPMETGIFAGMATANRPRLDVNQSTGYSGDHGFSFILPLQFKDGMAHRLYAYGESDGGLLTLLNGSPKEFRLSPPSSLSVSLRSGGGTTVSTQNLTGGVNVGYANVAPAAGARGSISGVSIFGFRQNGVLVSETAVPLSLPLQNGRVYVELTGGINTGLAMANPNNQSTSISYSFTATDGREVRTGSFPIAANSQVANFVDQLPFSVPIPFEGALSFRSTFPVAVAALRGLTNARGEFFADDTAGARHVDDRQDQ